MKTLIINGLLYDGSGKTPYSSNILIENEKIVAITNEKAISADSIIDADGSIVTPGFIDIHRHCDLDVLYNKDFGTIELSQGLTTVIGGNCGLAPIPAPVKYRKEIFDFIEPCLGKAPTAFSIESFADYVEALKQIDLPLHVGSFIGAGSVKAAVKGYGKAPFTKKEMELARDYIKEGLQAGAVGMSMGIMYQPECYSSREEIVSLVKMLAPFSRPLTCHIRGEGNHLLSSVREVIEIAKEAEVPLNISHFKATGKNNWGITIGRAIDLIEDARTQGQDVTVDAYPYSGGSTTLLSLLPPVMMEETVEQTLQVLSTKVGRERLCREIYNEHDRWDNMVTAIGWERILISSVTKGENLKYSGKTFSAAAELAGYDECALFLCDLLLEEDGKVGIIVLSMSQQDVDRVLKLPYSMVISDALYGVSDSPHPRLYGSFSKVLHEYVNERKILRLEEAIHKMTCLPAQRIALEGKGLIKEGYDADLLIFNPQMIRDNATYQQSKRLSSGIHRVLVNGKQVLVEDRIIVRDNGNVIQL